MNEIITAIKETIASTPLLALMGMLVVGWMGAMILIALLYRFFRTFSAVKKYDAACQQVEAIESKLAEMNTHVKELEEEFEKELSKAIETHNQESFELQQIIFERNSEILDLKNQLLRLTKS